MTKIEMVMKKDKEKLEYLYAKANTKSKKKRILRDLSYFSYLCQDCFDINIEFPWDNDKNLLMLKDDTITPFIEYTLENEDSINNIMKNIIDTFYTVNYDFYKDSEKPYGYLTEIEFQDIIFGFLNDYDPKLLQKVKDRMNNLEVFGGRTKKYSGFSFPIYSLGKNYLLYPPASENSVVTASILIHEIGHSYESDILKECSNVKNVDNIDKAPFSEVVSIFFEYAFLNYLRDNKIYIKDTIRAINYFYFGLLDCAFNISLLYKINKINIDNNGDVDINDDETVKYAYDIKEKLNCYFLTSELGEKINYRDSFIYGIGNTFGIYLYENYKNNPSNFKREFKNAIVSYPYGYMEAFERVGVSKEKLLEGKILKRVLKETLIK